MQDSKSILNCKKLHYALASKYKCEIARVI